MNKKKVFFISVSAVLIIVSMYFLLGGGKQMGRSNDAKTVKEVPTGFIPLPKGGGNWESGSHYIFWETEISFSDAELDAGGVCIYQTNVKNSDFIVKYNNEYYVNEGKLLELIDIADSNFKQHKQS